jgi:2'-5' RNA ligase
VTERMADHWWWRPGWRPGRRMYTWHFTFDGQDEVQALAARYRQRLAALPDLDLVPGRWLHLTTQGLAFTDEISDDDVSAVVSDACDRVKELPPVSAVVGPARVTPEALLMDVSPFHELAAVRAGIRAAITVVRGEVSESEEWTPHVSVAYSSGTGAAAPYIAALAREDSAPCLIGSVELIELNRDNRMYEWETIARVPLGGPQASRGVP